MANIQENLSNASDAVVSAVAQIPPHSPLFVGSMAAAVGLSYAASKRFDHNYDANHEAHATQFGNPGLYDTVQEDTDEVKKQMLRPVKLGALGAAILAASFIAHPTYHETVSLTDAQVSVAIDESSTMLYTYDIGGQSRSDAAKQAILKTSFPGKIGLSEVAATSQTVFTPTNDWRTLLGGVKDIAVDSNGGQFVTGLQHAAAELPLDLNTLKRSGEVIAITDGTVEDSVDALTAEAKLLEDQGIKAKIIVVGTAGSTYETPGTTIKTPSGAQPDKFSGFKDVTSVTTQAELTTAINSEFQSAGTSEQDSTWYIPYAAGGLLFVVSASLLGIREVRKKRN